MKTVFSGLQPSGNMHIGNYIGAIKQWVELQNKSDAIYCIVDLHAITVYQDPKILKEKILDVTALYLALGLDPKKAHIFIQSENPDHPYLAWILNCVTPFGQLERMTQFKDKSQTLLRQGSEGQGKKDSITVGLFDYPVLMAADILLYNTDEVPVGEDQRQHIELARDIAEKFNKKYGEVFTLPKAAIPEQSAKIMSLQNPNSKMSKSSIDPLGTINLLDSELEIREKVKKAVTDSETAILKQVHNKEDGAIPNLLTIYSAFSNESFDKVLNQFNGKNYGEFKKELVDLLVEKLGEIQKRYKEIREDEKYLRQVLDEGRDFAKEKSSETLQKVKEKMGIY